jgi:FtsP/CotA-like multicopper oxidase with cupredoxin domain/plastocyanin
MIFVTSSGKSASSPESLCQHRAVVSRLLRRVGIVVVLVVAAVVPVTGADPAPGGMSGMTGMAGMAGMAGMGSADAATVAVDDAPPAATVRIDRGATLFGYATPNVVLAKGGTLSVINFDSTRHSVTSDDHDAAGTPLFSTIVEPGMTMAVDGVGALAPGVYKFHCIFHSGTMVGTLTISGTGGGVAPAPLSFDQPLVQPKRLTTSRIRIPVKQAAVQVMPTGPLTTMWTYGGSYPGPTIVRPAGKDTKVTFVNQLPGKNSITVHLHGDHHRYQDDGQPTRFVVAHGKAKTYDFPLRDDGSAEPAAFLWYHDHRMMDTTRNNWLGLQGMFLTTDGWTKKLGLPTGPYDVPLMVSERSLDANNQLVPVMPHMAPMMGPMAPPNDATVGDHILVNGRFAPYLNVDTHRYRLRLLNTSPFTSYDFTLSDGRPFVQVGTGNGLLPRAVVRQDILLGPAQRADVIVDFRGELGKDVVLQSVPRINAPPGAAGSPSAQIMAFRVSGAVSDSTHVPVKLRPVLSMRTPKHVSAVWSVGLKKGLPGSAWTFDGRSFDPKRVVLKVAKGSTQLWELRNDTRMTHYIHLHEELWRTVSRDGKAPPPWERGLEDTWRLDPGERVRVMAKFTDFTGVFMIHCHMLDHEDDGLMAQFAVVSPTTGKLPKGYTYVPKGGPAALA